MDIDPGWVADNTSDIFLPDTRGFRIIEKYDLDRIICDPSGGDPYIYPRVSGFRPQPPANFFDPPGSLLKEESY